MGKKGIDPQSRTTGPYVTEVEEKHEIYPMEARLRNLAHLAPIALEMTPVINGREQDTELINIGNIPVMLKSKLCFLLNFHEKNLSPLEKTEMTRAATSSLTAPNAYRRHGRPGT